MRAHIKRHERIKMRLRVAGTSLAAIGRELGIQPTTVASVCRGTSRSRRVELRIAQVLGTQPQKLWPERYDAPDNCRAFAATTLGEVTIE